MGKPYGLMILCVFDFFYVFLKSGLKKKQAAKYFLFLRLVKDFTMKRLTYSLAGKLPVTRFVPSIIRAFV